MRRVPELPPPEFIPKDRWYTLLPKRSLPKIIALLLLLAAVIWFRGRAGSLVRVFGNVAPPASQQPTRALPNSRPLSPAGSGAGGQTVPSSSP